MNLKWIAIRLDNGLKVTFKLLTREENEAAYQRYLATDEPRILFQDMYKVTFKFEGANLYAYCDDDAITLILKLLGGYGVGRALEYFNCFVIGKRVIRDEEWHDKDSYALKNSRVLAILKQAVEENCSPNITALLNAEKTETNGVTEA